MEPNAPSYLERAADCQLLKALLARECVCMLDSRQKGKSSLVARAIVKLKEHGVATVKLDLQRIGANVSTEQWYAGLMVGMGQELGLTKELIEYWDSRKSMGPLARWLGAIAEVVLPRSDRPVVIFVDEVDFVRALDFSTDEFFAGIRDCFNRRSEMGGFERLTFCLVGVVTPGQLIRNPDITPFNIGTKIELTDFTLEETRHYGVVLGRDGRNGENLMKRVHYWVNGHPYLTQLLCQHIVENPDIATPSALDRLVKQLFLNPEARHTEPNLSAVEQRILDPDVPGLSLEERKTQVLDLYGRLLRGKCVDVVEENPVVASLKLAGVGHQVQGQLRVRNRVYRFVFDEGWRRQSLPNAELRRQRGAARLAILRTASVAGIVVLAISAAAVGILGIAKDREKALKNLGQRTTELTRVSSDRKSALTSLERLNEIQAQTAREREAALNSLEKTNKDLKEISEERQRVAQSLTKQSGQLKHRNEELSRISAERKEALASLGSRTNELQLKNYVGLMASIQLALKGDRYSRVADLVKQSSANPLRGWEWGHASMLVNSHEAEYLLPKGAVVERQPDRGICVITPDTIYDLTQKGLRLRRKVASPHLTPRGRYGNLRLQQDPNTLAYVFRDANTDQIVFSDSAPGRGLDIDAERSLILKSTPFSEGRPGMQIYSMRGGKPLATFEGLPSHPGLAKFMSDGTILSTHFGGDVIRWDRSGKKLSSQRIPYFVTYNGNNWNIATSRDGSLFCFYDLQYRLLEVRRTSDLSVVSTMSGPPVRASSCTMFLDRNQLVVGGYDGKVRVFKIDTGELLRTFTGHPSRVRNATFPWDGDDRLVSVDDDRNLRIWSFDSRPPIEVYKDQERQVALAELVNGGKTVLSMDHYGLSDRAILSRNLQTGQVDRRTVWNDCVFSEYHVFIALENGFVERVAANGLSFEKSVNVFKNGVYIITEFAKGTRLLAQNNLVPGESASREHAILDTHSMTVLSRFTLDWPKEASSPNYSFDRAEQKLLISSSVRGSRPGWSDGLGYLVSMDSGKILKAIRMEIPLDTATLTPDGKQIVVPLLEGSKSFMTPTLISVKTLRSVGAFPPVVASSLRLDLDPTGRTLVGRVRGGTAHLWDFQKREYIAVLSPGTEVNSIYFSPDGSRVVTGGPDQTNILWDARTGEELFTLRYEPLKKDIQMGGLPADYALFSADGRKIIMACTDGAVRIFNSHPWKNQPKAARK